MSAKSSRSVSLRSCSANQSNKEDYDIQTIEKHIQNLLNLLIKGLQKLDINEKIFDKFQNVFYSSDSLEEYLDGLYEMLKVLVTSMDVRLKKDSLEKSAKSSKIRETEKKKKIEQNESTLQNNKVLSDPNYENLEKVLQKYEAEIREHIRIEQQLKIYSDGLEEKIAEKEAETADKMKEMKKQISQLTDEKAKLSKLLYDTKFEKIFLEKKLKQKKDNSLYHCKEFRDPSMRKVKWICQEYCLRMWSRLFQY
jgi:chromosome segregation ATPase